jgi:hypothetical protein
MVGLQAGAVNNRFLITQNRPAPAFPNRFSPIPIGNTFSLTSARGIDRICGPSPKIDTRQFALSQQHALHGNHAITLPTCFGEQFLRKLRQSFGIASNHTVFLQLLTCSQCLRLKKDRVTADSRTSVELVFAEFDFVQRLIEKRCERRINHKPVSENQLVRHITTLTT